MGRLLGFAGPDLYLHHCRAQGPAAALQAGTLVTLTVTTEAVDAGPHAIFFNRGAVASQEYARRFQNQRPDVIGQAAFDWLSRGLVEGLETSLDLPAPVRVVRRLLRVQEPRIYDALQAARTRGAAVKILYDGDSQREPNETALEGSGIEDLTKAASIGQYAHNKFLVLRADRHVRGGVDRLDQPESERHLRPLEQRASRARPGIAEAYPILADPRRRPDAQADRDRRGGPGNRSAGRLERRHPARLFSAPHLDALDWYADIAGNAQRALFMTFASA